MTLMEMNGTRARLVPLARGQLVPLELRIGSDRIDVFIDQQGLHFRQEGGARASGHLSWEEAIAMSLLPAEWRRRAPAG